MTEAGGSGSCRFYECGTLFAITPAGQEHVFYNFKGYPDGFDPDGGLIYRNGEFYGTTTKGGAYDRGSVFKVDAFGSEHILHSFGATRDGEYPQAGLTDVNGTFYGTTKYGGGNTRGSIFKITPSGTETVIYSFGKNGRADGAWPTSSLALYKGILYGTTTSGGKYWCVSLRCGTVFSVTLSGKERVLYDFSESAGGLPTAGVVAINGDLYGTTSYGGLPTCLCGVVFKVTTSGRETILHGFRGNSDGARPAAGLTSAYGALYGTTSRGGGPYNHDCPNGCGTVYKIDSAGRESVIHRFGAIPDGHYPQGGLTPINGVLYGTTINGGSYCLSANVGCGTVYEILP